MWAWLLEVEEPFCNLQDDSQSPRMAEWKDERNLCSWWHLVLLPLEFLFFLHYKKSLLHAVQCSPNWHNHFLLASLQLVYVLQTVVKKSRFKALIWEFTSELFIDYWKWRCLPWVLCFSSIPSTQNLMPPTTPVLWATMCLNLGKAKWDEGVERER